MLRCKTTTIYMRKRITQAMDAIWEYPLTVVEAPMGYGKTTAVKEFFKDGDAQVLWKTLWDDSVSSFWNGFSRLFKKLDQTRAERLEAMGFPNNSTCIDEALNLIASMVLSARTVIVLDDYHLLSSKDVDRFIELLIKAGIRNLHVVILSRVIFGENTTELALKGYCAVIDKRSFELTRDEISEYYKLCGVRLANRDADALYSYTEGWISALYLCLLSFLQDGRVEHQASLYELIDKAVYRQCSAEIKEFLLTICIFDSFALEQAEHMWNQENTEAVLKRLMATNAFITYDKLNKTYQMHNIFTSYLRDLLYKQGTKKQQAVFLTAGEWYVNAREYIYAMDCFYKAADFDKLLTVMELDKGNSINNEHKEILNRYFRECPAEIKSKHPIAGLLYVRDLIIRNDPELFAAQCKELAKCIDNIPDELTKNQLAGELELIYIFTKYNDIAGMYEQIRKAYQLLKGPSKLLDHNASWTFGSPSVLYMFYRKSGELAQEVTDIIKAMPYYYQIAAGHGSGAECVMQAEHFYHSGDFTNTELIIHKAMHMARSHQQIGIIVCALFLQMRLAFVKGDLSSVTKLLQQMRADIKQSRQYIFVHTADMCEGFIYSCLSQSKDIPAWIMAGEVEESRLDFPSHAFFNIIYGKILLLRGEYLKLISIAEQFIVIANVFPNLLGHVYTHIYVAAANAKINHHENARTALRQAIDIAAPDELIMPFVENGEYILTILLEFKKAGEHAEFIDKIKEIYVLYARKVDSMSTASRNNDSTPMLTAREREIAELVASGLSNRSIAANLHIAEVTVKKALQNIYGKLGVNNRTALTKLVVEKKTG